MTQQIEAVDGHDATSDLEDLPKRLKSFREQGPVDDPLRKRIRFLASEKSGEGIESPLLDAFRSGVPVATVLRAHAAVAQAYQLAIDTVSALVGDSAGALVWLEHYASVRSVDGKISISSCRAAWNPATGEGLLFTRPGSHRETLSPAESVFRHVLLHSLRLPGRGEQEKDLLLVSDRQSFELQVVVPGRIDRSYAPSGEDTYFGCFPAGTHTSEARMRFKAARMVDDERRAASV